MELHLNFAGLAEQHHHHKPARFSKWYIPRYEVTAAQTEKAEYAFQAIKLPNAFLTYCMLYATGTQSFIMSSSAPVVCLYCVLRGNHCLNIAGVGNMDLKTNQYCVIFHPSLHAVLNVVECIEQVVLTVLFPVADVSSALSSFLDLHAFAKNIQLNKPAVLNRDPSFMHAGFYDLIAGVLHAPFTKTLTHVYEEICRGLLQEMLADAAKPFCKLPDNNIAYAAKQLMGSMSLQQCTVGYLAFKIGCSRNRLSKKFSSVFGIALGAYIRKIKMEVAWHAVTGTRTALKIVALNCGYSNIGNFCVAFKKHFNKTPRQARKENHK